MSSRVRALCHGWQGKVEVCHQKTGQRLRGRARHEKGLGARFMMSISRLVVVIARSVRRNFFLLILGSRIGGNMVRWKAR